MYFKVLGVFLALSLGIVIPSSWASKPQEKSKPPCQEILLPEVTWAWLQEHMRFGPEVTFTHPGLQNLPDLTKASLNIGRSYEDARAFQKYFEKDLLNNGLGLSKDHARIIKEFLADVLQLDHAELRIQNKSAGYFINGFNFHNHMLSVVFYWKTARQSIDFGVFNIKGNSIEVRFPPQRISQLKELWGPIFKNAIQHGFVPLPGYASGGGMGHMHLGFDSAENNLFLMKPPLVADLLRLLLRFPGVIFALNDISQHGWVSNAPTPFNPVTLELENDFSKLVFVLDQQGKINSFRDVMLEYATAFDHYSYISLKNINEDNPRLEVRFQRAYSKLLDLETSAQFWLHSIFTLFHGSKKLRTLLQTEKHYFQVSTLHKEYLEESLDLWLKVLGEKRRLPKTYASRLKNFSGYQSAIPIPLIQKKDVYPKPIEAYELPSDPCGLSFHVNVEIPLLEERFSSIKIGNISLKRKEFEGSVILDIRDPWSPDQTEVQFLNAQGRVLRSFVINIIPFIEDHAVYFRGEVSEEKKKTPEKGHHVILFNKTSWNTEGSLKKLNINGFDIEDFEYVENYDSYMVRIPQDYFKGDEKDLYFITAESDPAYSEGFWRSRLVQVFRPKIGRVPGELDLKDVLSWVKIPSFVKTKEDAARFNKTYLQEAIVLCTTLYSLKLHQADLVSLLQELESQVESRFSE